MEALSACPEAPDSDVTIFVDGPRDNSDLPMVEETRKISQEPWPFRTITLEFSESNKGLATSIIQGVTQVLKQKGKIIVLEDDLVVSPVFLTYMNQALNQFQLVPQVASIHGYSLPLKPGVNRPYFLRGADCWGWGSWVDRWESVEWSSAKLLSQVDSASGLGELFDLGGAYPYREMLKNQTAGTVDSWAIRWHASMFVQNRLTLYPGETLVTNIGMDGSGTHRSDRKDFMSPITRSLPDLQGIIVREDESARNQVAAYFRKSSSIWNRLMIRVDALMHRSSS